MNWSMAINFKGMPLRRSRRSMPVEEKNEQLTLKKEKRKKESDNQEFSMKTHTVTLVTQLRRLSKETFEFVRVKTNQPQRSFRQIVPSKRACHLQTPVEK